ncbi:uncharacterized protein LOC129586155 [Paramacrobiotus metropolitanus]|uniref:uncharacterized protein LOC129586155 n=1 Tax=Paramacrobiotus metropolitanus TaxID=2943436 RepID=UPI0024461D79|nr:uncharacterized protein LOC129586155 [Paramacrobiotus metropolitanus]
MEQTPVLPSRDTVHHITSFRDPTQTYLESPWTLWLVNKLGTQNKSWMDCIHPVATFSTIQQFWVGMYNSLKPPSELPVYWEYALFRGGLGRRIIVPDWDDHENIGGGCMQLTGFNLDTKIIDHLWRDICLKVIEEAWIHTSDYINGIMVSGKSGTTRFYVWVAPCKEHIWECVRDRIEGVFAQDCRTPIKWTPHIERKAMLDSKIAAKRNAPQKVRPPKVPTLPRHFRSRSVGYRTKLDVDVKTDEFLAAKRVAPEVKEVAAVPAKRPFHVKASQSSIMLRMGGGDSMRDVYHHPYSLLPSRPRGRSCHASKPYADYPVFGPEGDGRRLLGTGDMPANAVGNFKYLYGKSHEECAMAKPWRSLVHTGKEMVDVSTQFNARTTNGAGDADAPIRNLDPVEEN